MQPRTSVTIVYIAHNHEAFVADALESIMHQDSAPDQVLLINDGSRDATLLGLQAFVKRFNNAALVSHPSPIGLCTSFNRAIRNITSTLTVRLDGDDILSENYVRKVQDAFEQSPTDILYTDARMFGAVEGSLMVPTAFDIFELGRQNFIHASAAVRSAALREVGGLDPAFDVLGWEDWELWLRLTTKGYSAEYAPGATLHWRRHAHQSRNRLSAVQSDQLRQMLHARYPRYCTKPSPAQRARRIAGQVVRRAN